VQAPSPASATLSPRCNKVKVQDGVTIEACVSADLSIVYGDTYLYVNDTGLKFFRPPNASYIDADSRLYYGPTGGALIDYTGPHSASS
jgi:hypothetical protein